jgi:hypothetical protein
MVAKVFMRSMVTTDSNFGYPRETSIGELKATGVPNPLAPSIM